MAKKREKGRWSVEQRLEFIDFRLFWEGHVNRSDLVDFFGISVPQASSDLTQYQEGAKGNTVYDKTRKTYVASSKFKPVFFAPSADQYLGQLRQIHSGMISPDEAWAVNVPAYSIIPTLRRCIKTTTLRCILHAIRNNEALKITYQSMSSPEPSERWVAPHALGFDGSRWHARAWCFSRNTFRDFVLSRFISIGEVKPSEIESSDDIGWQQEVTLRIGPHPALEGGKRKAIELDYGMTEGALEITTRVCLAYYCVLQFGLNRLPSQVMPEHQLIALLNREEVESVMIETGVCDPSGLSEK
jgi:hypothetical protein